MKYVWQDKGWESIRARVTAGPAKTHAVAGVVGSEASQEHTDSGLTIGEIAILQEFGSMDGHTPSRSFLRRALIWNNRSEVKHVLAQVSRAVIFQGQSREVAMREVGRWAVRKIKQTITEGVPPPNASSTVAAKGHGLTLRDTFTLLEAIGFEVVRGYVDQGDES